MNYICKRLVSIKNKNRGTLIFFFHKVLFNQDQTYVDWENSYNRYRCDHLDRQGRLSRGFRGNGRRNFNSAWNRGYHHRGYYGCRRGNYRPDTVANPTKMSSELIHAGNSSTIGSCRPAKVHDNLYNAPKKAQTTNTASSGRPALPVLMLPSSFPTNEVLWETPSEGVSTSSDRLAKKGKVSGVTKVAEQWSDFPVAKRLKSTRGESDEKCPESINWANRTGWIPFRLVFVSKRILHPNSILVILTLLKYQITDI